MVDKYIRPEPPSVDELIEEKNALLTALNESTRAVQLLMPHFRHDGTDLANDTIALAKQVLIRAGVVPTITAARTGRFPAGDPARGPFTPDVRSDLLDRRVASAQELYAAYQRADEAEPNTVEPVAPELDLFQTDDADPDVENNP